MLRTCTHTIIVDIYAVCRHIFLRCFFFFFWQFHQAWRAHCTVLNNSHADTISCVHTYCYVFYQHFNNMCISKKQWKTARKLIISRENLLWFSMYLYTVCTCIYIAYIHIVHCTMYTQYLKLYSNVLKSHVGDYDSGNSPICLSYRLKNDGKSYAWWGTLSSACLFYLTFTIYKLLAENIRSSTQNQRPTE